METKKVIGTACSTVGCRYVGQRPGRYPQDTAESFVKWSSAGLLHSPAVELNGGKGDQWISRTKPFVQGWTHTGRRLRRFFAQKTVEGVLCQN